MRQVKRLLPYVRRYVQMAVYDVLDAEGAEYWKNESGAVVARLSVYGNAIRVCKRNALRVCKMKWLM